MKRIFAVSLSLVAASIGTALAITSVSAQTLSADLSKAAEDACTRSAESKGFTVRDVVSVEPKAGAAGSATEGATVVLNLDKAGQLYKLTCGYSAATGASISDSAAAATAEPAAPAISAEPTVPEPTVSEPTVSEPTVSEPTVAAAPAAAPITYPAPNLGWLLLPLVGLPLLLLLFKGRGHVPVAATRTERLEGLVRNRGRSLNVHNGPGREHNVLETLRDGQRILLSGRQKDGWLELSSGGWVPAEALDLEARQSLR